MTSDPRDPGDRRFPDPAAFLGQPASRRRVLGIGAGAAGLLGTALFAGPGSLAAPGGTLRSQAQLPPDAAPPEQQVYVVPTGVEAQVLDFYEQVYARPLLADLFSDPLVRFTKDFEIIPAAAERWESNAEGTVWTFYLDRTLVWSDGNPLTANDWVKTFQYAAEPSHAWDFTWFFQGVIKNWTEAIEGTVPVDQIGVRLGANEYELVYETVAAAPYLPTMLLYSLPLSKAALETTGPLYNTDPATAVSSGPFILSQWVRDQQIVYTRNGTYKGKLKPHFQRLVAKVAQPSTWFTMYENDEVDYMEKPQPAELQLVQADPERAGEIFSSVGDFRTYYLFFDVTKAPFDNPLVRQAFGHAVDRDAIQASILGPAGTQAYSWLAPGFPASNREGLADIQAYDPAKAKQLLAEAGFPDGEGFPKQEMWLRNENPINQTIATAIGQMLGENLGIEVEVSNKDTKLFTDSLNAKPTQILFGYVSYGMDYLDPSNMLSVWKSGGRHSWANPEFDAKLDQAAAFLGDPAERLALFQEAERILVSDVPGVFVYHDTPVQLIKPWVKGDALLPDENGIASIHWPGYAANTTVPEGLYVTADAPEGRG